MKTFVELELRPFRLGTALVWGQASVPLAPLLDARVLVLVENSGVELAAAQVAFHGVRGGGQLGVWWCFGGGGHTFSVQDRQCSGYGYTLSQ